MISQELLNKITLFQDLPEETWAEVRRSVRLKEYKKRAFVLVRGANADALLMLVTGRLQVIASSDSGKEIGINIIEPGDCFGEIAIIDGGLRSASVVALQPSLVGFLPKTQALFLFRNNPVIAERIQKRLCLTIRKEIEARSTMSSTNAFSRIYALMVSGHGQWPQTGPFILENLPSQNALASMAGVSRETVSRAISSLVRDEVIRKDARKIIVEDAQALYLLGTQRSVVTGAASIQSSDRSRKIEHNSVPIEVLGR